MILFADQRARVIGAAHAGWKGALTGVVEATVTAMERLGARPSDIVAALGPCIGQRSYEVGPEFVAAFAEADEDHGALLHAKPQRGPLDVQSQRLYRRARRARWSWTL